MAFGRIVVRACASKPMKSKKETPVKPVVKTVTPQEKGMAALEILLVAPTCEEAADYLCGVYFNLVQTLTGSKLSAYTREFSTISRLSEIKQGLEEIILKPVGGSYVRRTAEDEMPMEQCTLTLGQAGNTALAMDLHFKLVTPAQVSGQEADAVIALLNCAEDPEVAARNIQMVRLGAAGRPVFWVLANFEKKQLLWTSDGIAAPKVTMRSSLREQLGVSCQKNEYAVCAQIYGGLEFTGRKDGKAVLCSDYRCREYMPVGCHVPVIAMCEAVRKYRASVEENLIADATMERIRLLVQPHLDGIKGWYDVCNENGGGMA